MILSVDALYELISVAFWSVVVAIAALFLVRPFLYFVERWSNGGKYGR
jgi:uncharacterized membrane protein